MREINLKRFSDRILAVLEIRNWSQSELARRAKITRGTVNSWIAERNKSISAENLLAVSTAANVYPAWLANGQGPISEDHKNIGARIRAAREYKHWTLAELLNALQQSSIYHNLTLPDLQSIEAGSCVKITPDLQTFAEVLDVMPQSLSGDVIDKALSAKDDKAEKLMADFLNVINDGMQLGILSATPDTTPEALKMLARKFYNVHTGDSYSLPSEKDQAAAM